MPSNAPPVIVDQPGVQITGRGLEIPDGANVRVMLGDISANVDQSSYGLKVIGADGSTVIIDGTSDMFRIQATGTVSVVVANGGAGTFTSVSLSALGAQGSTPAALILASQNNSNSADRFIGTYINNAGINWAATTLNGAATQQVIIPNTAMATTHIDLDGSSFARITISGWNISGSSQTMVCRYYVLAQTAI